MKRLNNSIFIEKSNEVHNNRFDYSLVEYKNVRTPVKIICKSCGVFVQLPWTHMKGIGCVSCNYQTKDTFIEKSIVKHGYKYNYNNVNFVNNVSKVDIICDKHGVFRQSPASHISGSGCNICFRESKKSNKVKFIEKSNKKHNLSNYNYDLVDYINNKIKVKIICNKHGIFEQYPKHHLNGCGCPMCNMSKGEVEIRNYLYNNDIKYESQKTFVGCSYKSLLRFDFYLPEHNMCIEYNGVQHYEPVEYFGGLDNFIICQERDNIKKEYCSQVNIKLLIIKYNNNIFDKMKSIKIKKVST